MTRKPTQLKNPHNLKFRSKFLNTLVEGNQYVRAWQPNVAANDPLMIGYLFNAYNKKNINKTTLADAIGIEGVQGLYNITRGYTTDAPFYFTNTNAHLNFIMQSMPKYNRLRTNKIGSGIYFDTETLGLNLSGINNAYGITEFGFTIHDFKTNTKQSYGMLIGFTDDERRYIASRLDEIAQKGIQSKEDEILINRLAAYSNVELKKANINGNEVWTIAKTQTLSEFTSPSAKIQAARKGYNLFISNELKDQTFTSNKTRGVFEYFASLISDSNNIGVGHNVYMFDIPNLNAQFAKAGYGFNIDYSNTLDTLQLFRLGYRSDHNRLLNLVAQGKELPNDLMANVFEMEGLYNIMNIGNNSSPYHFAEVDTRALSDVMDIISNSSHEGTSEMRYIAKQLVSSLKGESIKYNIKPGEMLFFTKGVELGPTGIMQIETQSGLEVNPYGYINRKSIYTLEGFKKFNQQELLDYASKNMNAKQAAVVENAIKSGAIKDSTFITTLRDLRGNLILKFHKDAADVERFYGSAMPYAEGVNRGLLKSGQKVYAPHQVVQLNELDYAARRLRRFMDLGDTSATVTKLRGIYEVINKIAGYEDSLNIPATFDKRRNSSYIDFRKKVSKLLLYKTDIEGGLKYSEIEDILKKYYGDNITYSLLRDINTMYDYLRPEAAGMLDIIDMIDQKFPVFGNEYDDQARLILRKSAFKRATELKMTELSKAGIPTSLEFAKFNYESDVLAIPKDVFSTMSKQMNYDSDNIDDMYFFVQKNNFANNVSKIIDEMKNTLGITDSTQGDIFAQRRVNELINYLYSNGVIDKNTYERLSKDTIGSYYKLNELQKHIKPEILEQQTFKIEMPVILPLNESKAKEIISNVKQITSQELDKMIKTELLSNMSNKDEAIRQLTQSLGSEDAAVAVYEMLDNIAGKYGKNKGEKDLVFSIIKDQKTKSNYIAITAKEYADKMVRNEVLDKIDPNVALIELGSIEEIKGTRVFTRGGHKKIAGYHVDVSRAITAGYNGSTIQNGIRLSDSLTYAINNTRPVWSYAAEAFAEGDFARGARLINKKILGGIEVLPNANFDLHGNLIAPTRMDFVNTLKIYNDGLNNFGAIINPLDYQGLDSVAQKIKDTVSEYHKQKRSVFKDNKIKQKIDPRKGREIIRDLILSNPNSDLYKRVDKYSKITGFSLDDILDMMFTAHEVDYTHRASSYLLHPVAFSAGGIFTNVARPLFRQKASGQLIDAKQDSKHFFYGSKLNTTLEYGYTKKVSNLLGRRVVSDVTTKVLHISQDNLEKIIDTYLSSDEFKNLDKKTQERIKNELKALNVENQELIISKEIANAVSPTEFKEYLIEPNLTINKRILGKLQEGKTVELKAGDLIGKIYDKTTNAYSDIVADFTGVLSYSEDKNAMILKKTKKTNKRSVKVSVGETEKSEAYIASDPVIEAIRKTTGQDISVIMFEEQYKHKAVDSLIHNAVTKAYLDLKKNNMLEKSMPDLEKDIFEIWYPKELLEAAQQHGSGIKLDLSYGIGEQLTLDKLQKKFIRFDKEADSFIIEPSDRLITENQAAKDFVTKSRAKAMDRFFTKYNINPKTIVGTNSGNIEAFVSYERVGNLRDVDDVFAKGVRQELDKGVAFNARVVESLYRTAGTLGNPIFEPFVDELVEEAWGNRPGRQLVKESSKMKIRMLREDIEAVADYLASYVHGKGNINATKINITSLPYYQKGIEFEDIRDMMKSRNLKIFGINDKFVSVDLLTEVDVGGKKLKNIILPNLSLPAVGKNAFFATEYQKAVKNFVMSDIALREASKNMNSAEYEKALNDYKNSITDMITGIQKDMTSHEGMVNSLLNFRLKYSGMGKAKQLPLNDVYTAGTSEAEDILYISRKYAKRLLGEEYEQYAHLLDKNEAIKHLQKQLGKTNITQEELEQHWGMHGMVLRYPTIETLSAKTARVRIADSNVLGGRQIGMFFHTLYGMGGDIDSDEIGIALFKDFDKMSNKAKAAFHAKYKAQINQNKIIKEILASDRKNQLQSIYQALNNKTVEQLTSEEKSKIKELFSGFRNVDDIIAAFENKSSIGPANLGSYYLRRYSEVAAESGAIKVFKNRASARKTISAIQALTFAAEQKMISYKHGSQTNVGLDYMGHVIMQNANEVADMLRERRDDIKDLFATHYAINVAQYDANLARQVLNGGVDVNKLYDETVDAIRASVEVAKNKRISVNSFKLGIDDFKLDRNMSFAITKLSPVKKLIPVIEKFGAKSSMLSTGKRYKFRKTYASEEEILRKRLSSVAQESAKTAAQETQSAAQSIKNIMGSKVLKGAGLALGAMFVYGALFNTDPAKSRAADDVGLIDDEDYANVQPIFTSNVPIVMNDQPKYGFQINVNATNINGINHREMYDLIQNAFGTSVNVRMNINDNRRFDPMSVQEVVINSLNM